ncbi:MULTISPECIES: hypothetical protein [unclassified Geodermatophilus]|uniref:hypothetical protein n=1 Tax=unclassified Geodermatophilus TaxID=2637632 RepID=UPI003EEE1755
MQLRRPIAALMTALALFGGGATMTACGSPTTPSEGTTDDSGTDEELDEEESDRENLPDTSDQGGGADEDQNDDQQDPE